MTNSNQSRVVIIGAGQAGATAAMELRRLGHAGAITLVGDEDLPPYERPPLSKDALLRPEQAPQFIRESGHYAAMDVELRLGTSAVQVAAEERRVVLADGSSLPYDYLVLATGARARRLPMLDALDVPADGSEPGEVLHRVHTLRSVADAKRLRKQLVSGRKAILVGAGVIGLELASSLIDLGLSVELVDTAPRIMSRNAPECIGTLLHDAHVRRGVRLHLGVTVEAAQSDAQGVRLSLSDGNTVEGDVLIYGVGAVVNNALAHSAGVELLQGAVVVDERCQTSRPDILAVGDVAVTVSASGVATRLETWENANTQAVIAARTILGLEPEPLPVPWFWTDQCGMNLQFAGDMQAPEWLVRGSLQDASFLVWGLRDGLVVGAVTVNLGRDMRPAKELIAKRVAVPLGVLTDGGVNLRQLAKAPEQFSA